MGSEVEVKTRGHGAIVLVAIVLGALVGALGYFVSGKAREWEFQRTVMAPVGELLSRDVLTRGGPIQISGPIQSGTGIQSATGLVEGTDVRATVIAMTLGPPGVQSVQVMVSVPAKGKLTRDDLNEPGVMAATLEGMGVRPELAALFVQSPSGKDEPGYRAVYRGFTWLLEPPSSTKEPWILLYTVADLSQQGLEPVSFQSQ